MAHGEHQHHTRKRDWLLLGSAAVLVGGYFSHLLGVPLLAHLWHSIFELVNTVWWGIALGILMISVLGRIPREFVMSALGAGGGWRGISRAAVAGVLLDLCSHGILMVGAKLYERGASTGQVMAFLVASPWNSFSFTLILIAMIGIGWTLGFIVLSMAVALGTGIAFEALTRRGVLPGNPNSEEVAADFRFWSEAREGVSGLRLSWQGCVEMLADGLRESRMILRWIFLGLVLASLIRAFVPPETLTAWFGPTLAGLLATIAAATVIEVCSEGSAPIGADLVTRAAAPGNGFAFLMGGVVTDYTEILVVREATQSWKVALFLPLISLPQVVLIGYLLNVSA